MPSVGERLKNSWNAFLGRDPTRNSKAFRDPSFGGGYSNRPDRVRLNIRNERSIINTIYNQIAVDVSMTDIKHVRTDVNGKFTEVINSDLNNALTISANIDQTGRALTKDLVLSMFDEGSVAVVPVVTDHDPKDGSFKIYELRTGKIVEWFPKHIRVEIYNDNTGKREQIMVEKATTAIIENPFYSIMNEPNSTLQRLIRVLNQIDRFNENNSAGKLDMIIQMPYPIKSEARRIQAEQRRKDIEHQLTGSQYGIAYTDGTEKIVQLNRSLENNLWTEAKDLIEQLYKQLGFAPSIFDGTADEKTMLNYYNNTLAPILTVITEEYKRKWLTSTAITQGQSIIAIRDPFKLVPVNDLAEIADKFTRNEIMTSNEIRAVIGMKPANDPKADELVNSNIAQAGGEEMGGYAEEGIPPEEMNGEIQNEETNVADLPIDPEPDVGFDQRILQMPIPTDEEQLEDDLDQFDAELNELENMLLIHSNMEDGNYISHYASPYYDPVKAHEYYEKTKELKGRKSTAGLNDSGKEAARYVREKLQEERKAKVELHKEQTNSQKEGHRNQVKSEIESFKNNMQSSIDSLREELKNMSTDDRLNNRDRIQSEIAKLREENKSMRESLRQGLSNTIKGLSETHKEVAKQLKDEYDEKYIAELDKMKADRSLKSKTRRRR